MLSPKGKLIGDFTVSKLHDERFQLTASYASQSYHQRWFEQNLGGADVTIENISQQRLGYQIAGPKARQLLERVARGDVSNEAFPFLSVKQMQVGCSDAIIQRVSYTGDLGYEIYVPANQQVGLFDLLMQEGQDLGITPFGMRAMMSLRLEKSFGSWLNEFKPDYTPLETGLDRFVAYNKESDFIGKRAALEEKESGVSRVLCTFLVEAEDADVVADEPIWVDDKVIGFVTSGGYAHFSKKSVALGFLPIELLANGAGGIEVEIEILGTRRKAVTIESVLFDPQAERMRG